MAHCQICGRTISLRRKGLIGHHHVKGERCEGIGFPPIEQSDARLAEIALLAHEDARTARRVISDLLERRANQIEPALIACATRAEIRAERLSRRLARHRAWPARFARQMATQGYGSPAPAYLIST